MIPWLAVVRVGRRGPRLWLPVVLLWPLLPVCAVAGALVARAYRMAPVTVVVGAWRVISGSRGLQLEIDADGIAFQLRLI